MSSSLAGLQTMCSDEETGALSPENKDAEELGKVQARFYTTFDTLMTNSNSLIATYRTLVQCHGDCERLMKELVALGPSNSVTATVQTLQNHKAQLEQDMLVAEGVQCETWKTIQVLHDANQRLEVVKQLQERLERVSKRKANKMEGESGTESSQAE